MENMVFTDTCGASCVH